jgi:nicotinate-nucleotide adenylyltransferase
MQKNNNDKLKIGVFGGSFNPPHIGHVQAAEAALDQLTFDLLFIIPCGVPPHKPLPNNTPPPLSRF